MLIRNILEESVRKFDEVKAVKWLKKKEIMERSYGELMENVVSTRKGLLAEGFEGKHIALIGESTALKSSSQPNSSTATTSGKDRSQWQHIPICHWFRSSSRLS